jgi:hypothetical protein
MTEHPTQPPSFDPEVFAADLATRFDAFWAHEAEVNWRIDEATPQDKEREFEREVKFGTVIAAGALALAAAHDGPITVLFDIDDTLACVTYDDGEPRTSLRPSFPLIATELKRLIGDRLNIGLLTSRMQSHLDEERSKPTTLKGVIDAVNPELIVSSREDGEYASRIDEFTDEQRTKVGETMLWGVEGYKQGLSTDIIRKGWTLHLLTEIYSDNAFLVVDDHQWVNDINPDNSRVAGIHVTDTLFMV